MNRIRIATWSEVPDRVLTGATVENIDLVIVRRDDEHSVLYGRCLHRGARLADGEIVGDDIICGLHGWDYQIDTGVSAYNNAEALEKFTSVVEDDGLFVDLDEIMRWKMRHPQPYSPDVYQGLYKDPHGVPEEPYVMRIHELAANGLTKVGHHGFVAAMGVPRQQLPSWDDIQFVTAQLARLPLLDDVPVGTEICIGPNAEKPLFLDIPLFVSDMSFGALSQEAKTALARGAQLAGTGICSGEGGMLPEEQAENSRYFYELASARFGWNWDILTKVQAFHFKLGQGAKTGTGGHLPGPKVKGRIAEVRGLPEGTPAVSPPTFPDWHGLDDFRHFADEVRERSGGIPIGAKLSAQHIESDIDAALEIGVDYIILDGRGGGTGAAPLLFRDNISVPTIPALARARRHLEQRKRHDITPDCHRRLARRVRLRQSARARRARCGDREQRDPGHRLSRHARVPHQQLPGRDRNPETPLARPFAGRRSVAATRPLLARDGGAHASARACMRPRSPVAFRGRRPHDVQPRHGRLDRYPLRRCGVSVVWHKVADLDELPEGRVKTVTAGRASLALTHFNGAYGALDNHCPHQGGPLGEGSIEKGLLRCPWHGYDYDPITGTPPPGFSDAPKRHEVEVRDDGVYVALPPEMDRARTVSDLMVETMIAWGVTHVFGMVGHSNLGFADAMRVAETRGDLQFIGIRHEGAAAFAASAYGKLTGRLGACFAIAGPGSTNLLTGLYDAKVDGSPVLAISGQVPSKVRGRGRVPGSRSLRGVRRRRGLE